MKINVSIVSSLSLDRNLFQIYAAEENNRSAFTELVGDCIQLNPIVVWLENYITRWKFGIPYLLE